MRFKIGVGNPGRYKYSGASRRIDIPVCKSEDLRSFEDVPCFIVGIVNVKGIWAAAIPLMNRAGLTDRRQWLLNRGLSLWCICNDRCARRSLRSPDGRCCVTVLSGAVAGFRQE